MSWRTPGMIRLAAEARHQRRVAAEHAYEVIMARARLPRTDPFHLSYPEAAKQALAAYDRMRDER